MVVLTICGGGNAAHTLAGIASNQPNMEVRVLTLYADEAERWIKSMETNDFTTIKYATGKDPVHLKTKPKLVTKNPEQGATGADIIVITVPAFAHAQYLTALKPHVKPGTVVVGFPGQPGFDFEIMKIWGDLAKQCTVMNFVSLPWACRIKEFGKSVEVLATKDMMFGSVRNGTVAPKMDPTAMIQGCLGPLPRLECSGHLLGMSIMAVNGMLHPSIMYNRWHDWDGKPVDAPPLFYHGLSQAGADLLSDVSNETIAIAKKVMEQRQGVDLSNVIHMHPYYIGAYPDDISDKSSLYTCINTNAGFKGLTHPCTKTADGKFVPDFTGRYFGEDIPFGLAVTRGIAEIAGCPTPNIDKIIEWAQKLMGKEYLVGGKFTGKDISATRAPQRYGFNTLDSIL
uniref:Tauropine dehydrogenase n=1 Tax=Arabella iricolor TaxID=65494 RepID=TADH_ARAIR|nr:RecName: Full=Tauropine dehydrogenase; Short=TaDH; AltName: Full=NAD: tauropine oxidoreductase [Arabella iricolor]BAB86769.1 tauropine dehydrogenase [Arabella iricolor]